MGASWARIASASQIEPQALGGIVHALGLGHEFLVALVAPASLPADRSQAQEVVRIGIIGPPTDAEGVRVAVTRSSGQLLGRDGATLDGDPQHALPLLRQMFAHRRPGA